MAAAGEAGLQFLELGLGCSTERTGPISREVFESGSFRDVIDRIPLLRVIYITAHQAFVKFQFFHRIIVLFAKVRKKSWIILILEADAVDLKYKSLDPRRKILQKVREILQGLLNLQKQTELRRPFNRKREPIPIPPPAPLPEPEVIDVGEIFNEYVSGGIDLIVVLGPTASGKTRYAVNLAKRVNELAGGKFFAEIISADSRQVYKGMDIGTGKDLCEYGSVPYHLIDIVPAGTRFDLFQWQQAFEEAYKEIRSKGNVPILCGGTGLYIQAAASAYSLPQIPPDVELRETLDALEMEELAERLLSLMPEGAEIPPHLMQSKRRMVRALEVALYEKEHPAPRSSFLPKKPYLIGTLVSKEERNSRIDRRLEERLQEGMIEEVRGLLDEGVQAEDLIYYGLEYKFITHHILGVLTLEEMKTLLSTAIHQFAKRQMTWFRGMEKKGFDIHWTKV